MIKIENTETYGWEAAIRGMRNPMNSWDRSDTGYDVYEPDPEDDGVVWHYPVKVGEADHQLMMNLVAAGTEHAKFMRMITVTMDVTAPLYWWKEMDTYKIGTVANSCSTMHKIHAKEFTLDDFSTEHLGTCGKDVLNFTIRHLNSFREDFIETKDKEYWWQMIQLLPSSYNQRRTMQLNYAVLSAIYKQRKNHKLDEWHEFCRWIETMPYSEIITGGKQ